MSCASLVVCIMRNKSVKLFLSLDQWFRRKCCLKILLIWSSGIPFVQGIGTLCVILVEGIMSTLSFEPVARFWRP